uniref:G_PROTEIN_RECEP_F1_2 domain-containing protein n=1 Tax=Macrostomum lignano TaxID=282301 RepID=A0A1I8IWB9_9PLAT
NSTNLLKAGEAQRHRLEEWLTILFYSAAVLLSTVGNFTAIAVFSFGRQSRTELRGFLTSLAVADLLIGCFCLPFTLVNVYNKSWPLPGILCKLVAISTVTSSVFTNMVIGFDRFWVVTYPLNHRLNYSRSRIVICCLWLISLLLSSVQLLVSGKKRVNDTDQCREHWDSNRNQRVYSVFVLVLTYLLPLGVLSLTYAAIGRQLWNRTIPGNADLARDSQHIRAKRKIVKMLIVVVTLFALCWMPLHVFNVLSDYTELNTWLPGVTLDRIFIVSHWTAMANSFVNPMVYGFMNDTFKADLRDLAQRLRCCRSGRQLQVPVTIVARQTEAAAAPTSEIR